ncbi:LOW QUALITY PROTEIN: Hypothetical protein PHPALM_17948 [Phytophthora palmivora]|uniref:Uncharacterized protein n=1 Tax=Phytophthora palmivora TaxID=4796 RepID=A0A2P4XL16_9STRA|nr:LOW QUALITY PROTEIN: Hypothetical protein PHPALM_17948 [Phytophthora palmivora]
MSSVKYECRSAGKNDFELFCIIKKRARTQHKYHALSLEYKQKTEKSSDKRAPAKDTKDAKPRKNREQPRIEDNPQGCTWQEFHPSSLWLSVLTGFESAPPPMRRIGAEPWRSCAPNEMGSEYGPRRCALTNGSAPRRRGAGERDDNRPILCKLGI